MNGSTGHQLSDAPAFNLIGCAAHSCVAWRVHEAVQEAGEASTSAAAPAPALCARHPAAGGSLSSLLGGSTGREEGEQLLYKL